MFLVTIIDNKFMQKGMSGRYLLILLLSALAILVGTHTAAAVTSTSPSYQVIDTQFGTGTTVHGCSDQYCARVSIGDIDGTAPPVQNTAEFSEDVGSDPLIEVIIEAGDSSLGVLTTERTATKTTSVKIRNHLSGGYNLQIMGDPPKFDGHTLATPPTPAASVPGTEQFAINLASNSAPKVGSAPAHEPVEAFSSVEVDGRYSMSDLFMYKSGDVVVRNTADSGLTEYTLSMIVNIANSTPAGHYSGDFYVLVVPAY